jgi:hypothetical protein
MYERKDGMAILGATAFETGDASTGEDIDLATGEDSTTRFISTVSVASMNFLASVCVW